MLNPDQKKPPTISRTWMAVAAALVAVVGVGSLFAVFNQDDENDIDTVDTPEVTVPLELDAEQEPDVLVPDESAPDDGSESNAAVADPDPGAGLRRGHHRRITPAGAVRAASAPSKDSQWQF